jgi:SH3-like domain-containing protein
MIYAHLYARLPDTPVFHNPVDDGVPLHYLHAGDWVGVINSEDDWIQVIGIECTGWVKASDLEPRPPMQLHACWQEGKPIEYVNGQGCV